MIIRPVTVEEKTRFNAAAGHPLQAWEWGAFRQANGQSVERFGIFDETGKLLQSIQVTFHDLPGGFGTVGYVPKGPLPDVAQLEALKEVGRRHRAVFIKLEPDALAPADAVEPFAPTEQLITEHGGKLGRTLFTRYTYILDLDKSPEALMEQMKSKTRYNVRLAKRKGVTIVEDTTEAGLESYLTLLRETTERQGFYAHNEAYFRTMWSTLKDTGMIRILKAEMNGKVLSTWVLFIFNGVAYYPYGASSREDRDVMANNLMMWEAMMLAKEAGCTEFDLWGALGLEPDPKHKWYGFHRFKEGYGPAHMQALPTYDLVLNAPVYAIFTWIDALRWTVLRLRASLGI